MIKTQLLEELENIRKYLHTDLTPYNNINDVPINLKQFATKGITKDGNIFIIWMDKAEAYRIFNNMVTNILRQESQSSKKDDDKETADTLTLLKEYNDKLESKKYEDKAV